MKRKIVQHGSSSLTITLPRKWVQKFALKKGNELNVEESGSSIIISTEREVSTCKKVINSHEWGLFTKNDLSHLYQLGYDEIEINFDDEKTLQEIKSRISDCIGYEIIDMRPNRVYIKCIATTLDSEFDTLLRKSFLIINEMAKEMLSALAAEDLSKMQEIRRMEDLNNRFTDACIRILNKKGCENPQRNMQMYEIVKNVERIADEFKYLCDVFSDEKKIDKKMVSLLKEVIDYYMNYYALFYKFDPKLEQKMYLDRKALRKKLMEEIKSSKGNNSLALHCLLNIVQKTYEGCGSYLAMML